MRSVALLIPLLMVAGAGCSGSAPTRHVLADAVSLTFAHGAETPIGVQQPSRIDYDAASPSGDAFDICILPKSETPAWEQDQPTTGFACHTRTSAPVHDGVDVPAGAYVLAERCRNANSTCHVVVSVTATY